MKIIISPDNIYKNTMSLYFNINSLRKKIFYLKQGIMKANIILLILVVQCKADQFDEFKAEMEQKVMGLAQEMQSIYERRCDDDIVECKVKSVNWCQGTGKKECFDDYPSDPSCLTAGSYLSDQSVFRFPNSIDIDNLTNKNRQMACASAILESKLQQLNNNRNNLYTLAYFGTNQGSIRVHPGNFVFDAQNGECPDFDPRFRPWYTSGSSGAKNVVIIIDVSGSMQGTRIRIAKEAAMSVINTFGNNDFVGVVTFSADEVHTLYSKKISRATNELKAGLNQKIDEIQLGTGTNYELALQKAFQLIASAETDEYGAPCSQAENIFLFLTDGAPTRGKNTPQELIALIDEKNAEYDVKLFTYALGSTPDLDILRRLSCAFKGIMFQIEDSADSSELISKMREYYEYLTEGVMIDQPVWTEPYDDAFDAGRMVTVSMPVYYMEDGVRKVLGVIGIDVVMDTFYNSGFADEDQIIAELIKNAPCQVSSLSECQIEALRSINSKCNVEGCAESNDSTLICNLTSTDIFISADTQDSNLCCSISIGGFTAIIVIAAVVLISIGVGCYCRRRCEREESIQDQKQGSGRQIKADSGEDLRSAKKRSVMNPNPYFNQNS